MKDSNYNPAQEGIDAAKADAAMKDFMGLVCSDFKSFVMDAIDQGIHQNYTDHFDFLKSCLEVFTEIHNDDQ